MTWAKTYIARPPKVEATEITQEDVHTLIRETGVDAVVIRYARGEDSSVHLYLNGGEEPLSAKFGDYVTRYENSWNDVGVMEREVFGKMYIPDPEEELRERNRQAIENEMNQDPISGEVTHSEDTLFKVRKALMKTGLIGTSADDMIREMQNAGILFRERG